jgi:hypothetical protein
MVAKNPLLYVDRAWVIVIACAALGVSFGFGFWIGSGTRDSQLPLSPTSSDAIYQNCLDNLHKTINRPVIMKELQEYEYMVASTCYNTIGRSNALARV